jgi:hypothetical protein
VRRIAVGVFALAALVGCGDSSDPAPAATAGPASVTATDHDGCSPDNSPTDVLVTPGAAADVQVRAESASADTPLPDLVVRRINCAGGWVNLRNEVPADKPVLVWFWAPY